MTIDVRFEIDPAILERFPACRVGGFLARGLTAAAHRAKLEAAETVAAVTCLHADTDVGVFMAEAVAEIQYPSLEAALAELARDLEDAGAAVGGLVFAQASARSVTARLE